MKTAGSSVAQGRERRIALLKPQNAKDERILHAMQLLSSMLWAFKGSTRSMWITVPPDEAEVIVIHREHEDTRVAEWRAKGKQVLEITMSADAVVSESHVLVYPFRAAQALKLLERLDSQLRRNANPGEEGNSDGWACAFTTAGEWNAVEALRQMRAQPGGPWLAGFKSGTPVLWLSSNAASYFSNIDTAESLRNGSLRLSELRLREDALPPPQMILRPGIELTWFAAYHASKEPAPWLDPLTRYRIQRWPNFNAIRPSAAQIRIAAALIAADANLTEIVSRASVSREEATRTLNALSACDVIVPGQSSAVTTLEMAGHSTERRGRLGALLRNMRKHLGLRV